MAKVFILIGKTDSRVTKSKRKIHSRSVTTMNNKNQTRPPVITDSLP